MLRFERSKLFKCVNEEDVIDKDLTVFAFCRLEETDPRSCEEDWVESVKTESM